MELSKGRAIKLLILPLKEAKGEYRIAFVKD
jgi:hypothetical protein